MTKKPKLLIVLPVTWAILVSSLSKAIASSVALEIVLLKRLTALVAIARAVNRLIDAANVCVNLLAEELALSREVLTLSMLRCACEAFLT